ncbi:MAG: thymidine phosphorylase [Candidatus Bipolaricaulota bacterium]|nr:MAG: thymidine phosphorylase [Candidatus Bipolaricaulota bacterium]
MNMVDIIRKKRDGGSLTRDELQYVIDHYIAGDVPDYQISALLMAIFFQSMSDEETAQLTDVMAHSGTILDLSDMPGVAVDKHSTGGVGDTTTLVLIPLLAAADLTVAKLSGRSLGHTGGTIDKLESIPGFRTDLSREEFLRLVRETGLALADHTEDMVPADRLLYELRDVTSTVDSLPLIVSSIMSKKIAGGAEAMVIDVKTGAGAFLTRLEDSRKLAGSLVAIGRKLGRKITALITDMSQPLGRMVGNALEVREAIDTLQGHGPKDLEDLCLELGAELLLSAERAASREEAVQSLKGLIDGGQALGKLRLLIENQGGNPHVLEDPALLPTAAQVVDLPSPTSGHVVGLDALAVGRASCVLGAGRLVKEDEVDFAVGVELIAKIGDPVESGEPLARLHVNRADAPLDEARGMVLGAYQIGPAVVSPPALIVERVTA